MISDSWYGSCGHSSYHVRIGDVTLNDDVGLTLDISHLRRQRRLPIHRFYYHRIIHSFTFVLFAVCVKTVEQFAATLIEEVKNDPKLIEDEFKKYCSGTKSKQQRFVSTFFSVYSKNIELNWCLLLITVLLFGWSGDIGYWHPEWAHQTVELVIAGAENLREAQEEGWTNLWFAIRWVSRTSSWRPLKSVRPWSILCVINIHNLVIHPHRWHKNV